MTHASGWPLRLRQLGRIPLAASTLALTLAACGTNDRKADTTAASMSASATAAAGTMTMPDSSGWAECRAWQT